MRFNIVGSLAD